MSDPQTSVLVIGYGNPGRLDDGLGPAFAAALAADGAPGVTVESDYQLSVEDAAAAAEHDVVVFADAAVAGREPFYLCPCRPQPGMSYSSHAVSPQGVMGLARQLFGAETRGYMLGIRGYEFNEFEERLSERARRNLEEALRFFRRVVRERCFEDALTDKTDPAAVDAASIKGD